jgi:Ca-activated chloride channel family protein
VILLTDGENTAGEFDPVQAAELASTMGIKIYTIGVGTKGRAPFPVRNTPSGQLLVQYELVNIDEKTLRDIADATGGQYFRATETSSLESIYEEIDQLEKTKVETQQFVDYKELAIESTRLAGYEVPPLLLVALCLLAARVILNHTILRQLG